MANKRNIGLSVLFNLLKGKKPYGIVGIAMIILSALILLFIFPFSIGFAGVNDNYDFSLIEKKGLEKDAQITYIKTVNNLTINEQHPLIVSYEYNVSGNKIKDKFETLDLENIAGFKVGSVIKVLIYNHQSMIKGVEPYFFPKWVFFIPACVFFIGAILLLLGFIPAYKIYNLYRTGIIKDAVITAVGFDDSMPALFNTKTPVNYYFIDDEQNKIYGESEAADAFFWTQKKVGDNIKILVSPNDETRTCIIPLALMVNVVVPHKIINN